MFLTQMEIEELTGLKQPARQIRWLLANGYCPDVRADGRPAVLEDPVRNRQLRTIRAKRATEPNLSVLDK